MLINLISMQNRLNNEAYKSKHSLVFCANVFLFGNTFLSSLKAGKTNYCANPQGGLVLLNAPSNCQNKSEQSAHFPASQSFGRHRQQSCVALVSKHQNFHKLGKNPVGNKGTPMRLFPWCIVAFWHMTNDCFLSKYGLSPYGEQTSHGYGGGHGWANLFLIKDAIKRTSRFIYTVKTNGANMYLYVTGAMPI